MGLYQNESLFCLYFATEPEGVFSCGKAACTTAVAVATQPQQKITCVNALWNNSNETKEKNVSKLRIFAENSTKFHLLSCVPKVRAVCWSDSEIADIELTMHSSTKPWVHSKILEPVMTTWEFSVKFHGKIRRKSEENSLKRRRKFHEKSTFSKTLSWSGGEKTPFFNLRSSPASNFVEKIICFCVCFMSDYL